MFEDTHPIPLSLESIQAYKSQKIPLREAPGSQFSLALLTAFSDILSLVTSRWSRERIEKWSNLVDIVKREFAREDNAQREDERRFANLRVQAQEAETLRGQLDQERQREEESTSFVGSWLRRPPA